MLSQNVVLFCQKGTTGQKTTSYAVLKGHFWITEKRTTVLDSPMLSFFAKLLDRIGLSKSVVLFYSRAQIPPPQMLEHQAQASPTLMRLPSLLLHAGSRRGACLTPPTSSSLGSFSMAASSVDVLLPATALAVALVALHEIQRHDLSPEVKPVDELPREKLTRSHRKKRDVKTCAWAQLLEDKDLDDSTSITAKQFRVDFRIPYPFFLRLVELVKSKDWFPTAAKNAEGRPSHPVEHKVSLRRVDL